MTLNVLLITPFFPPQDTVASLRTRSFARHWARQPDVALTVLTTTKREDQGQLDTSCSGATIVEIEPEVPAWLDMIRGAEKSSAAPSANRSLYGVGERIRMLHRRLGVFGGVRMPDLTDHWVRPALAWAEGHGPWDAVVSSSGPYTAHLVALALRRAGRAFTWIADFRDLWTQNHAAGGLFPFVLRERALERQCLEVADRVVTVSDGLAETLNGRVRGRVDVITNGFDPEEFEVLDPTPVFPDDGKVRLVYTGTVYPAGHDATPLWRAVAALRSKAPALSDRLRIAVAGRDETWWRRQAADADASAALEWHGVQPRATALRMQRDADALLSIEWTGDASGVVSTKIFEYLHAGPPVFVLGAADDGVIASLVRETGRGARWSPSDVTDALEAFVRNPPESQPPDERLERYRRDHLAGKMLEIVRNAAGARLGT